MAGRAVSNGLRLHGAVEPPNFGGQFFFPASAYWPVWPGQSIVLSRSGEKICIGPFNWGGAHCAGERVKHKTGPKLQKSLHQKHQQPTGHDPRQQPGTPRSGSQLHTPRSNTTQTNRDFEGSSSYTLTYMEHSGTWSNPVMYRDSSHTVCEGSRMRKIKLQLSTMNQRGELRSKEPT